MTIIRRDFLQFLASLTAASVLPVRSGNAEALQQVRVATGLLAMWQSTAWLGAEAGIFKKHGIDMTFPGIAVGGPPGAGAGIRGDWEFAHTGALPVAEETLKGHDIVVLATPTAVFASSFVM